MFEEYAYGDSNGDDYNFLIETYLEAGQTYMLRVSSSPSENCPLFIAVTDSFTGYHTYSDETTVVEPGCTNNGYNEKVCVNCSHRYQYDFKDPLGHVVENGVCTRCEKAISTLILNEPHKSTEDTNGQMRSFLYCFTPTTAGTYYFFSDSAFDPNGTLYDNSGHELAYNDDGGDGLNFLIEADLEAGQIYHLEVYGEVSEQYPLYVTVTDNYTGCHGNLQENPGAAPSCTDCGYTSSKQCTRCGLYVEYSEEIPALGHNYGGSRLRHLLAPQRVRRPKPAPAAMQARREISQVSATTSSIMPQRQRLAQPSAGKHMIPAHAATTRPTKRLRQQGITTMQ